jgi:hypothetical protein
MAVPVLRTPLITTEIVNEVPTFSMPSYSLLDTTRWLIEISHSVRPARNCFDVWLEAEATSIKSHFSEIVQLFAAAITGVVPLSPAYIKMFLPNITAISFIF